MSESNIASSKLGNRSDHLIVLLFLGYLSIGSVFYHLVEKWNWLDSIYFTVITLATVGYGDFSPKTAPGKVFTIFYVFIGIGIFIFTANHVLKKRVERRVGIHQERQSKKKE